MVLPLRHGAGGNKVFGLLCLEFGDLVECCDIGRERVGVMGRAIAKAIWLYETTNEQRRGTQNALDGLEQRIRTHPSRVGLSPPSVFLAFSSKADKDVMEIIRDVLGNYAWIVALDDWERHRQAGQITEQLLHAITGAAFGICYFSEPDPTSKKFAYRDNPNVLVEAGMMNVAFHSYGKARSCWLLIRERDDGEDPFTSKPPFDIEGQRFLRVPRRPPRKGAKRASLDKAAFATALKEHLDPLFSA